MPSSKKKQEKSNEVELTVEERYLKMDPHEHVLTLPDTYIGGIHEDSHKMWVFDDDKKKIALKNISYVPGLYKICDEIFVNACDQTIRDSTCCTIKIKIDKSKGIISCYNDGDNGIPIAIHKDEKMYVPEMIFGNLRTSGNYKQSKKIVGGKNGYGGKLANIFSTKFKVEVVDLKCNKKYSQMFSKNMYEKTEPTITKATGEKSSYVRVSFSPDFEKFGIEGLSDDIVSLLKKRVYDIAACTKNSVKVFLNGELIEVSSFKDYVELFYEGELDSSSYVYNTVNDRWKVCAVYDPNSGYRQISYVNGICTFKGGSHEKHVIEQITGYISDAIKKKHKDLKFKNSQIKENITLFICSTIEDPSFSSQIKEELTSKLSTFGSRCDLSEDFMKVMLKTGIVDEVVNFARLKEKSTMTNSDGKKTTSISGIPKLKDANWAGGKRSKECRLILTEGDSAATFAIAGIESIGQDRFGVFPLKGKLLNVRSSGDKKLIENEEIKNIKKIMGLKQNEVYDENLTGLRYGGILILTDQDVDGSHIKGLIINFVHFFWPSLMKIEGFVQTLATPIIKVWKTNDVKKKNPKIFYTLTEFEEWNETNPKGWTKPKYYKGLGTSTDKEAREAFDGYDDKLVDYVCGEDVDGVNGCDEAINLAFNKKLADKRKKWLEQYDRSEIIDNSVKKVLVNEFINKDLIHFSNYDLERAIPSMCDGFKPSQRKIMFGSFLRKIFKDEIKVAQLVGFISDKASYHHGEASLEGAIVKMAQDYVGSNNINLLSPNGNFGSRSYGGKNASSARYIFTQISKLTPTIFRKEDECVYEYNEDDGKKIEPVVYAPIIPVILVNGCDGIGTGYSTDIPCYNPKEIVENIVRMLKGKKLKNMSPWYKGFNGDIVEFNNKGTISYKTIGKYSIIDKNTIEITELPIGKWTNSYKEFLEGLIIENKPESKKTKTEGKKTKTKTKAELDKERKEKEKRILQGFKDNSGNNSVNFVLTFDEGVVQELVKSDKIVSTLQLSTNISISNMVAYNKEGVIRRYDNVEEIMAEFFDFRISMYAKRKEHRLRILKNELDLISWKVKFIEMVISGEIIVFEKNKSVKKATIIERLVELEFPKLAASVEAAEESKSYSYITSMGLFLLTEEELEKLREENEVKSAEFKKYEETSIQDMWLEEIKEFEKAYDKWIADQDKDDKIVPRKGKGKGTKKPTKGTTKKPTKGTKKSVKGKTKK